MSRQSGRRRPADDLDELKAQLLSALEAVENPPAGALDEQPHRFRAYLYHAMTQVWRGVARGDFGVPRRTLDVLLEAQPFVDAHLPEPPTPPAAAAVEVQCVLRSLYTAAAALQVVQTEARLADKSRSRTEREVLRVLFESRSAEGELQYLKRGSVHERLRASLPDPPTPARVSQVLAELYEEGLLLCLKGPTQGNPSASFYALSPRGIAVCRKLELGVEPKPGAERNLTHHAPENKDTSRRSRYQQALDVIEDRDRPWEYRLIASGSVGSSRIPAERISEEIRSKDLDDTTVELLKKAKETAEELAELAYER